MAQGDLSRFGRCLATGLLVIGCSAGSAGLGGEADTSEREEVDCNTITCAEDEICVPWEDGCDTNLGRCVQRANVACSDGNICGCDGNIYESSCDALAARTRQADPSACAAPDGRFVCGGMYCELGSEVCRRTTINDCQSSPSISYQCVPLPDECSQDVTCECARTVVSGDTDVVIGECSSKPFGTGTYAQWDCQGTTGTLNQTCNYFNMYCTG